MKQIQFIETMRVVDGQIANLNAHLFRMRNTIIESFGANSDLPNLCSLVVPIDAKKCRIVYDTQIQSIEFSDYEPRRVTSLKLVEASPELDYHLKYADRSDLLSLRERRADCDDILIVKNGYITDTSYSNVVFTDGNVFVTPNSFLLPGTMRSLLLQKGEIAEASITIEDIKNYTHVALINAMLPLHTVPFIPVSNIKSF